MVVTEQTIDMERTGSKERIRYPDLYKGNYVDVAGINYTLEMNAFVNECRGIKSGMDIEQGAYIQRVIDAMYYSAKSKERIVVE